MKQFIRSTLVAVSLFSVPVFAEESQKPPPTAPAADELITVKAGNAKTLQIPGVTRLALGNTDYADVSIAGGNVIRIEGVKAGETMLIVWTGSTRKTYRILVQK